MAKNKDYLCKAISNYKKNANKKHRSPFNFCLETKSSLQTCCSIPVSIVKQINPACYKIHINSFFKVQQPSCLHLKVKKFRVKLLTFTGKMLVLRLRSWEPMENFNAPALTCKNHYLRGGKKIYCHTALIHLQCCFAFSSQLLLLAL